MEPLGSEIYLRWLRYGHLTHSYLAQVVRSTNFCLGMFLLLFLPGELCIGLLLNEHPYSYWAPNMISFHSSKFPIWWHPFRRYRTNILCQKETNFKQNLPKASLLYYQLSMTVSESRGEDRKWQLVTSEIKRDTCIVREKI